MTIPLKWNFLFPQLLNDFICKSLCTGYPDGSRIQHSSTLLKWITVNGERTGKGVESDGYRVLQKKLAQLTNVHVVDNTNYTHTHTYT